MEPEAIKSYVTVTRTSPEDLQDRQVIVTIDDRPFATLMYGKTATREVAPGLHSLRVDNTWNKQTIRFNLAPGEHLRFRTINRSGRFTSFLASFGAGPIYVSVEREV